MIEAESLARGFGMPGEHAVEMGVGCVGRPGWQAFAVFSDNEIIASAALFIKGSAAHLPGAATLPAARRRAPSRR